MAQRSAGKHDEWQGYITVHVVNHGIITSIRMLTAGICPIIIFDIDTHQDCVPKEVKWMVAIR